jgi:two-component system sensor histidine kinase KdpD
MPLRMGVRTIGAVALAGEILSRETLEALGGLIAIAVERAGAMEKLTRAEAARENEQLRTALLDSVTHEFRTPLTGIKAAVTSLLSGVELRAEQRKELLTVIDEESDRLDRLVGEATEMAQLDAHKVELHIEPHSIRDAVDAAVRDAKHELEKHPIEVKVPEDTPPVRMDLERIREVLKHLLENAGKYSAPGTPIRISSELNGNKLITSVADQGPGIDDFELSLIFEKFYRGRDQRFSVQGTGMGLAIAKAILEAHGGSLAVTSQLGRGSVFHFSLPAQ